MFLRSLVHQVFDFKFRVTEDLAKKSRPDCLSSMHRHNGASAVRMTKKVMTFFDSYHFKSGTTESLDKLIAAETRKFGHGYTTTVCNPTKWVAVGFSTSRQS